MKELKYNPTRLLVGMILLSLLFIGIERYQWNYLLGTFIFLFSAVLIFWYSILPSYQSRIQTIVTPWIFCFLIAISLGIYQLVYLFLPISFFSSEHLLYGREIHFLTNGLIFLLTIYLARAVKGHQHQTKFVLNISVICTLFTLFFVGTFLWDNPLHTFVLAGGLSLGIYLLPNCLSVFLLFILIFGAEDNPLRSNFRLMLMGLILYLMEDFVFLYMDFVENTTHPLLEWVTFFSVTLFALSSLENGSEKRLSYDGRFSSYKTVHLRIIILFLFGLYFLLSGNIYNMVFVSSLIVFYLIMSRLIRKNITNSQLIDLEKRINSSLDDTVRERSLKLVRLNKNLETHLVMDPVTGIENRRAYIQMLDDLIQQEVSFSVFNIGINGFKLMANTYGHDIVDLILRHIACRLKSTLRNNSQVFRIGSDEFAVVIEQVTTPNTLSLYAKEMIQEIGKPMDISFYSFTLQVGISILSYPEFVTTQENILQYSNMVLRESKNSAYSTYLFFDNTQREKIERRKELEIAFESIDFEKDLSVLYQPQFDIVSDRLIGMESTLVWNHPTQGPIRFEELMSIIESSGKLMQLSRYALSIIFRDIKKWNTLPGPNLKVSINIPEKQLRYPEYFTLATNYFKQEKVSPEWFDLEVTENSAMLSYDYALDLFLFLSKQGFHISLKKFGEGYSSLSYIKNMKIDRLKISQSLVSEIGNPANQTIIQTILMMAEGIGLEIMAQGVSASEELTLLKQLGYRQCQGDFLGTPVNSEDFESIYLNH